MIIIIIQPMWIHVLMVCNSFFSFMYSTTVMTVHLKKLLTQSFITHDKEDMFVCLFVRKITQKLWTRFPWNLVECCWMDGAMLAWLWIRRQSQDLFSLSLFHTVRLFFTIFSENNWWNIRLISASVKIRMEPVGPWWRGVRSWVPMQFSMRL